MNLCIVCLDALREDHVTPEIMPYLHGLAETGTRYRGVKCQTAWTLTSVAAMLTGDDEAFEKGQQVGRPSLATRLSETHDTAAFFGQGAVWPMPEMQWLWDTFDYTWSYMDAADWLQNCRQMDGVWDAFREWRQSRGIPHPWFAYIHLFEVHEPYTTAPIKVSVPQTIENGYFANRVNLETGQIEATEEEQASLRRAYVDYCHATDEKLAKFLPEVLDGDTILFVVTDHGDNHGEGGVWGHGPGAPWQTDAARRLFWAVIGPKIKVCEVETTSTNAALPGVAIELLRFASGGDEVDIEAVKQRLADLGYLGGG